MYEIQPAALCLHIILRSQLDSPQAVSLLISELFRYLILQMRPSLWVQHSTRDLLQKGVANKQAKIVSEVKEVS